MHQGIYFLLIAACAIFWLPSNVCVRCNNANDALTTRYHGNNVAPSARVERPMMLPLGVLRRSLLISRRSSAGDETKMRRGFWKENKGGPLPVDATLGGQEDEQPNDFWQRHKAMRYG